MGMPAPYDPWAAERIALARRRRRRRRQRRMLWLLTGVTTAVLLAIAVFIIDISKIPTVASPAALSASARPSGGATASGAARHQVSPRPSRPAALPPRLADAESGLSYRLLPSPWQRGCPSTLNTPAFSWTAGENAVAGQVVIGGSAVDWHGLACSGLLQQGSAYAGPAGLEQAALGLVAAFDPAYYSGVRHSRTLLDSSAMQVSRHRAWIVRFSMTYDPQDVSQGVTWGSESGAVMVIDRGPGRAPAVFYVSVPSSLGTGNVTLLTRSVWVSS